MQKNAVVLIVIKTIVVVVVIVNFVSSLFLNISLITSWLVTRFSCLY